MNTKEQKEIFLKLAEYIRRSGVLYNECLVSEEKYDENISSIIEIEKEADELRDKLDEEFKKQKNIPYLALDRAKLLRRIDDSLDEFLNSVHTLRQFSYKLPANFRKRISYFAKKLEEVAQELANGIKVIFESFDDAAKYVAEIENLRDQGMASGYELISSYFEELDEKEGWKAFVAIERVIMGAIECLTTMKDCSEVLEVMIYKYD